MSERLPWIVAIACFLAIAAASTAWVLANPLPSYFDEAVYANQAIFDRAAVVTLGASGIADAFFRGDVHRPPGFRFVALPFTLFLGARLLILRLLSAIGFAAAAALLALAVRRVAGDFAAALAFVFATASPVLILATRMFGSEYSLLFALAALLFLLTDERTASIRWLLMGAVIGLGLLSKAAFVPAAAPMIVAALLLFPGQRSSNTKGALLGVAIAAPWWIVNWSSSMRYLASSAGFARHHLPTIGRFGFEFVRCVTGFGGAAAIVLLAIGARSGIGRRSRDLSLIALAGAIAAPLLSLSSGNHNPRLVATTALLLAAVAGAMAAGAKPIVRLAAAALLVAQVIAIVAPHARETPSYVWRGASEVMAPIEQWDWTPLRRLCDSRGITVPRIAVAGDGYQLSGPSVVYAWSAAARRAEMATGADAPRTADVIVTAPGFRGDPSDGQPPLNARNEAVARHFTRDPEFEGPFALDVGLHEPALVVAFVRRHHATRR